MDTIPKLTPQFKELTTQTKWKVQLFRLRDRISKRVWRKLIISFLIVIMMSFYFYHMGQVQKVKQAQVLGVIQNVEKVYNESMALVDTQPDQAQALLHQAKMSVDTLFLSKPDAVGLVLIQEWEKKINEGLTFTQKNYFVEPEVFIELPLIVKAAHGDSLFLNQDVLLVWDKENNALYRINAVTKAARVLSGGEKLRDVLDMTVAGEEIYVLQSKGIGRIDIEGNVQSVIARDEMWQEPLFLRVFSGNLYILDRGAGQIWKYPGIEIGYDSRQEYLLYDTVVDLGRVADVAINGHVWIVRDGQIVRFTQGAEDYWQVSGVDPALGNTLVLFSDELTEHLYILDVENSRIVVTNMAGIYVAQYTYPKELEIKDMVASEVLKKIILLSNDTIYTMQLK